MDGDTRFCLAIGNTIINQFFLRQFTEKIAKNALPCSDSYNITELLGLSDYYGVCLSIEKQSKGLTLNNQHSPVPPKSLGNTRRIG